MNATVLAPSINGLVSRYFGLSVESVFGLVTDYHILTQYNISNYERGQGIKPGYLCVETTHGDYKEFDAITLSNYVASFKEGVIRRYYFKSVESR